MVGPATMGPPMVDKQAPPQDDKRTTITTSHIPLFKMPKKHLLAIIENIEPRLDTCIVGPLDQNSVAMVLWLLTRIELSTYVKGFHVSFYDELRDLFKTKSARLKLKDESAFSRVIETLVRSACDVELVHSIAIEKGFDPSQLNAYNKGKYEKRNREETKARLEHLHSMFKRKKETTGGNSSLEPPPAQPSQLAEGLEIHLPAFCPDYIALKWAIDAKKDAHNGRTKDATHAIFLSGDVYWCGRCGSYGNGCGLRRPCPGPPTKYNTCLLYTSDAADE